MRKMLTRTIVLAIRQGARVPKIMAWWLRSAPSVNPRSLDLARRTPLRLVHPVIVRAYQVRAEENLAPPKRCAHLSLILVDDGIETEGVADAVVEAGRHTRKASPNVIVVAGGAGESVEVTKRRLTIPQVQNLTRQVFEAEGGDGPMACAGESA